MTKQGSRQFASYRVQGFGGGLNKAVNSFILRDDELQDAKNVQFGLKGSIRPRAGFRPYDTTTDDLITAGDPVKGLFRYSKSDGTRELVAQAGQKIFNDSDTGVFSLLTSMLRVSEDGFVRFAQWRDTLFITSDTWWGFYKSFKVYHSGETTEVFVPQLSGLYGGPVPFSADVTASGNLDTTKKYFYRFSLEKYQGDDFLGETNAVSQDSTFLQIGGNPASGGIDIKKAYDDAGNGLPVVGDSKYINVYRSIPIPSADDDISDTLLDENFGFLGQILVSDWDAADNGDVLFEDHGNAKPFFGQTIKYNVLWGPPPCRFLTVHKNRMWYGRIDSFQTTFHGDTGVQESINVEKSLSRIYFSEYLQPEAVLRTSFFDIGPMDGEGITGMISWKNKGLFVFKPNSIWGVFGGDVESPLLGIPDIEIEAIDEALGCIAPGSIATGEGGIMFLSNRGMYFFDGTRAFPMATEVIDPILKTMPAGKRYYASGVYINKDRKYWLAVSSSEVDSDRLSVVLEYDFFTRTWSRHQFLSDFGFNSFVEAKKGDEVGTLYGASDLAAGDLATTHAVQVIGDVYYESTTANGIAWYAETKSFDCGEPDRVKSFKAVIIRTKTPQSYTVDWTIDDGLKTGSLTLVATSNYTWDESGLNWQGADPAETVDHFWGGVTQGDKALFFAQEDGAIGKRISFKFNGTATIPDTEIQGMTIIYSREDRIE